jgi:hypothetical protein
MQKDVIGHASILTPCQCVIRYPRNIQQEWFASRYCVFMLTSTSSGITYLAATHPDIEKIQFVNFSYRKEAIEHEYAILPWEEIVLANGNDEPFVYKAAPSLKELDYFFKKHKAS